MKRIPVAEKIAQPCEAVVMSEHIEFWHTFWLWASTIIAQESKFCRVTCCC